MSIEIQQEVNLKFLEEISVYVGKQPAYDAEHQAKLAKFVGIIDGLRAAYIETGSIDFTQLFIASRLFERYVRSIEGETAVEDLAARRAREVAEEARLLPLRLKQSVQKGMREQCQDFAIERWGGPQRGLRLADMCQEVWQDAHNWLMAAKGTYAHDEEMLRIIADFRDALPDKPDGLKSWLRAVAPKSASARGRPKKK